MTKKILVHTPFGKDANSFWRCMGPMSYLSKSSQGEIEIFTFSPGTEVNWNAVDKFDLLFLHRPCRPEDLTLLQIARNLNIPVWIDYDDWLFHLPPWNPNKGTYHNPGIQHIMATCLACADVVSTSTPALFKEFIQINKNTIMVPNAYRSDIFGYRKSNDMPPRKDIFVWRGTNTHEADLLSVKEAFLKLPNKVHFLGSPPYSLISMLEPKGYSITGMSDPILYWKRLYELNPKVLLCPLDNDFFNHCKSNIAWIEAIHAGAVCIAPDHMEQWQRPGVITYQAHDPNSFEQAALQAMSMSELEIKKIVSDAFAYMMDKYDIAVVNAIRWEILRTAFSPSFERNQRDPYDQKIGLWALSVLKKTPLPRVGGNE